jgi:uncharacterized SAM-binding protein YcdF (DUF218 family)
MISLVTLRKQMRILRFLIPLLILAALASQAARFLIVDDPQKSDAILVLAGETAARPTRGLQLLRQEMAPHLFIDVESGSQQFDQRLVDIAEKYIATLPDHARVSVCAITGLSTNAETTDAHRCLDLIGAHSVLIVTSEFHTRRARSIFRKRLPQFQVSVAAARDPLRFGTAWWTNREWAKVTFDEWTKLIWWNCVDRWRS